jgi:hypothetical protein
LGALFHQISSERDRRDGARRRRQLAGCKGSITESLSTLECTIDPNEINKKAGGGAQCSFETAK